MRRTGGECLLRGTRGVTSSHHRHFIFTIPVALRQLFLRERRLLSILPRCAFETVKRCFKAVLGQEDGPPGMVAAIQCFGS
jgi:hypothetical protein